LSLECKELENASLLAGVRTARNYGCNALVTTDSRYRITYSLVRSSAKLEAGVLHLGIKHAVTHVYIKAINITFSARSLRFKGLVLFPEELYTARREEYGDRLSS
jgi:hypothetical protein